MTIAPDVIDAAALAIRAQFASFSPARVQAAALQPIAPYLDFMGEGFRGSIIEYPSQADQPMCLRPDYTLALALDVAQGRCALGALVYDDLVYRGDAGAQAHETVHRQVGLEIFGDAASDDKDGALLGAALASVQAAGVSAPLVFFTDVGVVHQVIAALPLAPARRTDLRRSFATHASFLRALHQARKGAQPASALAQALASLDDQRACEAIEEIFALANVTAIGDRSVEEIAARMREKALHADQGLSDSHIAALQRLSEIAGSLDQVEADVAAACAVFGVDCASVFARWRSNLASGLAQCPNAQFKLDFGLGRGFSYYDGFVFEVRHPVTKILLAGGGRYDGLIAGLSGGALALRALGAMVRPDRICMGGDDA